MYRIESRLMRRFVILLLLVVMQSQLAWGAAAAYCEHEPGAAAASHFGHHEHRHAASDAASTQPGSGDNLGKLLGADPDCQSCHFANLGVVPGPAETPIARLAVVPAAVPLASFDSFIPDGLERRDRRTHAAA